MSVSDDLSLSLAGIPGRIALKTSGFTSFTTTTFPFGGVEVGPIADFRATRSEGTYQVRAEEWGVEVVDDLYLGETWALSFALRGWRQTADQSGLLLTYLFPNVATGTTTRRPVIASSSTNQLLPGYSKGNHAGALRLVFYPDDPERMPGLVAYRVIPKVARVLELPFMPREEQRILIGFVCVRPAAGSPAVRWGPLADVTG